LIVVGGTGKQMRQILKNDINIVGVVSSPKRITISICPLMIFEKLPVTHVRVFFHYFLLQSNDFPRIKPTTTNIKLQK
jgi:hypothetical protein